MRLVLQRVRSALVTVDGETVGSIGIGMLVLCGVESGDGPEA
ncbi:MAG: D-aminoacyl-tRNA deacylase, partial [Thermoanaerobaculia bacterium]|nr:D-aminoacyl-tRNA deacylase [Thermoanaerobaculia bacterium]